MPQSYADAALQADHPQSYCPRPRSAQAIQTHSADPEHWLGGYLDFEGFVAQAGDEVGQQGQQGPLQAPGGSALLAARLPDLVAGMLSHYIHQLQGFLLVASGGTAKRLSC